MFPCEHGLASVFRKRELAPSQSYLRKFHLHLASRREVQLEWLQRVESFGGTLNVGQSIVTTTGLMPSSTRRRVEVRFWPQWYAVNGLPYSVSVMKAEYSVTSFRLWRRQGGCP